MSALVDKRAAASIIPKSKDNELNTHLNWIEAPRFKRLQTAFVTANMHGSYRDRGGVGKLK